MENHVTPLHLAVDALTLFLSLIICIVRRPKSSLSGHVRFLIYVASFVLFALDRDEDGGSILIVLVVYPSLDRIEHRFLMMNAPVKVGRCGDVFARKGVLSA